MRLAYEYIEKERKLGANDYNPLPVVIEKGSGVWVWDVNGKRYLDCLSAYSALNQGHCHPRLVNTMTHQANYLTLTSRAFYNTELSKFYSTILDLTGFERVLPMNTGAEAVETSIKLARKWGYTKKGIKKNNANIIVCDGNFHGRTTTIVGFSTNYRAHEYFGPYSDGFTIIPFGSVLELERNITDNTVAFLVEPIQGEGGVIIPPDGYLKSVEKICKENNILLILDEIQTGLGRTGKLFAKDYEDVKGDLVLVGKALSGGFYPISAVLTSNDVMDVLLSGEHGSTFGGNPLAASIATTALSVIVDEKLVENSAKMGKKLLNGLLDIDSSIIREVRGRGLMIAVELYPEAGGARKYCLKLMEEGILCKDCHEDILRISPPLIITEREIDWALERFRKVLSD